LTFGEEDDPDDDIAFEWSVAVDEYDEPKLSCRAEGEYLYVNLYEGTNDLHIQFKHQFGEGLVMDLVEHGEIFDSLGYLTYEDMNREEEDPDETLDGELKKFDYKDKLEDPAFNEAVEKIKTTYSKMIVDMDENEINTLKNKILNSLATGGEFAEEAFFALNDMFAERGTIKKDGWEADITPERARELIEGLYLDREVLQNRKDSVQKDILELIRGRRENVNFSMMASHNTILALRDWRDNVSFIVAQGTERGLINVFDVDAHLSVDRYEPSVAKQWLKEPLEVNDSNDEYSTKLKKVALSESELREIVIADKTTNLSATKDSQFLEASLTAIIEGGGDIVKKAKERNAEKRQDSAENRKNPETRKMS